jgi:hypothetical protein
MTEMTAKQAQRQDYRDRKSGQYAEVNLCDLCERSVGVDYSSAMHTDTTMPDGTSFADAGIVLHRDCCAIVDAMPIAEAFEFLTNVSLEARRKVLTAHRRAAKKVVGWTTSDIDPRNGLPASEDMGDEKEVEA